MDRHCCGRRKWVLSELNAHPAVARIAQADGLTPLFYAVRAGQTKVAAALLQAGVEPSPICHRFWTCLTPLHLALKYRHHDLAKILLESGADPNAYDSKASVPHTYWPTPLHVAARWGAVDDIHLLLDHRAEIYAGATQQSSLDAGICSWVIRSDNTGLMEVLLTHGLDLHDNRCRWLLHDAAAAGQPEMVRLLLARGMSSTGLDPQGRSPYQCAMNSGNRIAAELLKNAIDR